MGEIKAKKENKVYIITGQQKARYLQEGFDIYDDEGNLLEHSPKKKIAYSEYAKLQEEMEALKDGKTGDNPDVLTILQSYAADHGIDLGRAETIIGIVKKIKEHVPEGGE